MVETAKKKTKTQERSTMRVKIIVQTGDRMRGRHKIKTKKY